MAKKRMSIIERLHNPDWQEHVGEASVLNPMRTQADMIEAANEIEQLRSALSGIIDYIESRPSLNAKLGSNGGSLVADAVELLQHGPSPVGGNQTWRVFPITYDGAKIVIHLGEGYPVYVQPSVALALGRALIAAVELPNREGGTQ